MIIGVPSGLVVHSCQQYNISGVFFCSNKRCDKNFTPLPHKMWLAEVKSCNRDLASIPGRLNKALFKRPGIEANHDHSHSVLLYGCNF